MSVRIVVWWTPVILSADRIELPSTSNWTTLQAFSRGRYMLPTDWRCSENVLRQVGQRKRWVPLRFLPNFRQSAAQL